ncbi:MAG: tRNA (adenosine(37)-N6)-threonylcarbamoyltransferase complex dimerization subunit type 1 TsaB [Bryobacteraceae bacterium]
MIILAVDLTSEFGSLAIRRDGRNVIERSVESRTGFAHLLFPALESILSEADIKLAEITCFAVSTGPGAFTGLRVAIAGVKGLAEVMSKPALGVSKMRAMASFGTANARIVLLDARRGEAFAAVYNEALEPVVEETVTKARDWLALLPENHPYQLITADAEWLGPIVATTAFETAERIETPRLLAGAVALCAEDDLRRGGVAGDPLVLDANYVRRSDAELYWTDN